MASGDHFDFIKGPEFVRQGGMLATDCLRPSNALGGVALGKNDVYTSEFMVNNNGTPLVTGITANLLICDDPANPNPGGVVRLGVSFKSLVSGSADLTAPPASGQVIGSFTTSATFNNVTVQDVAVPIASIPGLVAGSRCLVQIARIGTDPLDTHKGRVLLSGCGLRDT